jgi:DNA-binding transcriptional ArsR family regulator
LDQKHEHDAAVRTDNGLEKSLELFKQCSPVFQSLGDPCRQRIVMMLAEHGALNVKQITEHSHLSRPAISHHLKILRQAGLVRVEQRGTENLYKLIIRDALQQMKQLIITIENEMQYDSIDS